MIANFIFVGYLIHSFLTDKIQYPVLFLVCFYIFVLS